MNSLKTICTFVLFISLCAILYTACKKKDDDPCKNIHCLNGGACNNGACVCPTGYTGTYCETAAAIDPCKNVVCQHGGTCNNGVCSCPAGYEGANCQTPVRDKFLGTYSGNENCTTGADSYSVKLLADTNDAKMLLTNFFNQADTVQCTIAATDSFFFSGTVAALTYSGSGKLIGNSLTVRYNVSTGTHIFNCTFIGNK